MLYAQPGNYLAQLVSMNAAGEGEAIREHSVVMIAPHVNFDYLTVDNGDVIFDNLSENVMASHWSFGDGTVSSEFSPVHTYTQSGSYIVELMIWNGCGVNLMQKVVNINLATGTDDHNWLQEFRLYPNPNPGTFTVEMTGTPQDEVEFILYDLLGQIVKRETADFHGGDLKQVFNYGELPAALYTLGIHSGKEVVFVKVAIQR